MIDYGQNSYAIHRIHFKTAIEISKYGTVSLVEFLIKGSLILVLKKQRYNVG